MSFTCKESLIANRLYFDRWIQQINSSKTTSCSDTNDGENLIVRNEKLKLQTKVALIIQLFKM